MGSGWHWGSDSDDHGKWIFSGLDPTNKGAPPKTHFFFFKNGSYDFLMDFEKKLELEKSSKPPFGDISPKICENLLILLVKSRNPLINEKTKDF